MIASGDADGLTLWRVGPTTPDTIPPILSTIALFQNYPNPFKPETWIPFQLRKGTDVVITIYDLKGRVIRRFDLGYREAGVYLRRDKALHWDGRNELGERVASGIYLYELRAGDFKAVRKMVIAR